MVEQGIGYSDLARRSGIDARAIMRIRHAQMLRPWISTIADLALALDVEPLWPRLPLDETGREPFFESA